MNLSKIHYIAIIVSDYEASKDFYVNKLGFAVIRENYRPEACGLRHLAFCVDSVEQTVKELTEVGIECEPVRVELGSEFRYRNPLLDKNSLVVVISQSGETVDSLAALREAKEKGVRTLGIVNVVGSSIAREADSVE